MEDVRDKQLPLWGWLESTKDLQENTYGYQLPIDPEATVTVNARSYYLMWNTLAAMVELAELSIEFSWKPWAVDNPFANVDRMTAEAVDAGHFIGNILTGVGVNDHEYTKAYQRKQKINRDRAASGSYSAKKGGLGDGSD